MYNLIEYSPSKNESYKDFIMRNSLDWKNILQTIFGIAMPYPQEYKWTKKEDIVKILKVIGNVPNSNHLLFPTGGGMDLIDADISMENDCIELIFDHQAYICKPEYLQFVSFQADEKWFYFRLDTNKLEPISTECDVDGNYEYLIELNNGELINRNNENDDYMKDFFRYVSRILSGSMVIFAKSSIYNYDGGTYDGRHNKMDADEFKKYIEKSISHINIM